MKNFINENFEFFIIAAFVLAVILILYNLITIYIHECNKALKISKTTKERKLIKIKNKIVKRLKIGSIKQFLNFFLKFRLKLFIFVNFLIVGLLGLSLYFAFVPLPKVLGSTPKQGSVWMNPENYIEVRFSRPIKTKDVKMHLAPDIEGEWKEVRTFKNLPFVTKMRFYPKNTILPGEKVIIYAVGYNPKVIGEHMIEFNSPLLANISSTNLEDSTLNTSFPLDGDIEIGLDNPMGDYLKWRAELNPPIELELVEDRKNKTIKISPKNRLMLATNYNFKLFRTRVSYNIQDKSIVEQMEEELVKEINFTSDASAIVQSLEPTGNGILTDTAIMINFGKLLSKDAIENALTFDPPIDGNIEWLDEYSLKFVPTSALTKETKYKIILKKGLLYQDNVATKEDIVFDFETIGKVQVTKFNIQDGQTGVSARIDIRADFNQEVDTTSAQNAFSVDPPVAGDFSWVGNTIIFKPKASLAFSKKYTVKIASGVVSINGLDSAQEFGFSFTTEPGIFSLSVPYYQQVRRFECELIALKMALAYRGIYLSADQIMAEIGVSSVPYNEATNTWGDPNVYFVGDVTGASKGYGVHLAPLARVAGAHGRRTAIQTNWNVASLAAEVQAGNPVIVLWQNGWSAPTDISWQTPEGKRIYAINGTHAGVVVGFTGSVSSPTSMIVQDPWNRGGSRRTYSISSFNSLWNYHGRSALVVY